jgi:hypothetical protein
MGGEWFSRQEILKTLLKSTEFEASGTKPFRAFGRAMGTTEASGHQNLANLLNEQRLAIERARKEVEFMKAVVARDCVNVKGYLEEGFSKSDALEVFTEMASLLPQSMEKVRSYDLYNSTVADAQSGNFEAVKLLL